MAAGGVQAQRGPGGQLHHRAPGDADAEGAPLHRHVRDLRGRPSAGCVGRVHVERVRVARRQQVRRQHEGCPVLGHVREPWRMRRALPTVDKLRSGAVPSIPSGAVAPIQSGGGPQRQRLPRVNREGRGVGEVQRRGR